MGFKLKSFFVVVLLWWAVTLSLSNEIHHQTYFSRRIHRNPCDGFPCYPPSGNLLVGRENQLFASSTCGLRGEERYCTSEDGKCLTCDSRSSSRTVNHEIDQLALSGVKSYEKGWWQSENGVENVTIQLNLESLFDMTHIVLTFKNNRPKAMYIEKSFDFGNSWTVSRYFAQNCSAAFPDISIKPLGPTNVFCDSRYSSIFPFAGGSVIYRVFSARMPVPDPNADEVQNLMKTTNIRLRLTQLHTLNGDDPSGENKENYFYALSDFVVRGTCRCNGHASKCIMKDDEEEKLSKVYSACDCTHNTDGDHCDNCNDEYNLSWKPSDANVCKNVE